MAERDRPLLPRRADRQPQNSRLDQFAVPIPPATRHSCHPANNDFLDTHPRQWTSRERGIRWQPRYSEYGKSWEARMLESWEPSRAIGNIEGRRDSAERTNRVDR